MVATPSPRRHSARHRRTASILAQRAISRVSPVRESERRAERRRLQRQRERRRDAAFYRGLLQYCGVPPEPPRRRRRVQRPPPVVELPIVVSSDTSAENIQPPVPAQPIIIDLDSSLESLPNIDPRPQWQLPVPPLQDLGHLDITAEFAAPLQHQALRGAYVLLHRLQLPPLQPLSPPPEQQLCPPTPPPEQQVDWVGLEAAVAGFDNLEIEIELPPPLALQQPAAVPRPENVPPQFLQPQQMPPVDWAIIAYALFTIAEREGAQRGHE